jgi:hypothetical protein
MLEALIEGQENPVQLADFAQRQLRGKIPELEKALQGHLTEHHRFMLRLLWKQLAQQEGLIAELNSKIEEQTRPFEDEIERLDAVPGSITWWPRSCWRKWEPTCSPFQPISTWPHGRGCVRATKTVRANAADGASPLAIAGSNEPSYKPPGQPATPRTLT